MKDARVLHQGENVTLRDLSAQWREATMSEMYVYNFNWLGRPIIQYPTDIVALQEIIWRTRPDLIIETGIAHGGSLLLSASMLALLDLCDARTELNPSTAITKPRQVVGVDIEIRDHNRSAIESHPLSGSIHMIQGSSVDPSVVDQVAEIASNYDRVMVCLDSNHTHEHVSAELEAYSPLVSSGNYCIVFDTFIEDLPSGFFVDRPWDAGNSAGSAARHFMQSHPEFEVDRTIEAQLLVTVAPGGFLRRR